MKKTFLILISLVIYFYLNNLYFKIFLADVYCVSAKRLTKNSDFQEALSDIKVAINANSLEPSYYKEAAKIYLAQAMLRGDDYLEYKDLKQKSYEHLKTAKFLNTKNISTIRNSIYLYYFLAVDDPNYIQITRDYFGELKILYPNDLGVFVEIAGYERKLGLYEDYNYSKKVVEELRPDILKWHENFN